MKLYDSERFSFWMVIACVIISYGFVVYGFFKEGYKLDDFNHLEERVRYLEEGLMEARLKSLEERFK